MKKKQHDLSVLKHEILQNLASRKELVRKLKRSEAEFLSNFLLVKPYLYQINLAIFANRPVTKSSAGIVKNLYYEEYRKEHKKYTYQVLTLKQAKICENFGLKPKIYKYKIQKY